MKLLQIKGHRATAFFSIEDPHNHLSFGPNPIILTLTLTNTNPTLLTPTRNLTLILVLTATLTLVLLRLRKQRLNPWDLGPHHTTLVQSLASLFSRNTLNINFDKVNSSVSPCSLLKMTRHRIAFVHVCL